MATPIRHGRYTVEADDSFVVFIVGMRINRFWSFTKWVPTFLAMGPMLRELYQHPEYGFLSYETYLNWRGVTLIQYWRSFDSLEKYAKGGKHLKAWRRFNRSIGSDGSVGIFHETYVVQSGQYECIYGNMPLYGLAKATKSVPATGKKETARRRMAVNNQPIGEEADRYS